MTDKTESVVVDVDVLKGILSTALAINQNSNEIDTISYSDSIRSLVIDYDQDGDLRYLQEDLESYRDENYKRESFNATESQKIVISQLTDAERKDMGILGDSPDEQSMFTNAIYAVSALFEKKQIRLTTHLVNDELIPLVQLGDEAHEKGMRENPKKYGFFFVDKQGKYILNFLTKAIGIERLTEPNYQEQIAELNKKLSEADELYHGLTVEADAYCYEKQRLQKKVEELTEDNKKLSLVLKTLSNNEVNNETN